MTDAETARKGRILEQYADAVTEEIRKSILDAMPQLSADDFSELIKFHKTIDWSRIAEQCYEKIHHRIEADFDETWDDFRMKTKIALLEFLRQRAKNKGIEQWRPFNKTPSEQCRPYILEILDGKIYYLHQYLQEQQKKLMEDLVPAVDSYRKRIQKVTEQRDLLMSQMERMEETNKFNIEVIQELDQNLKSLRRLHRTRGDETALDSN